MRIAALSDIHANRPALMATLAAADGEGADEIWALGDIVGRGPHPEECARMVLERCSLVLTGNHDRVCLGIDPFDWLGPDADIARWTYSQMHEATRRQLGEYPPAATRHHLLCIHGGPEDPAWQFISTAADARATFAALKAQTILVGHTHQSMAMRQKGAEVAITRNPHSVRIGDVRQILNPGAVGIPPRRDPGVASWCMIDLDEGRVTWHYTAYDVAITHRDVLAAGFSERVARPFAPARR